ncbi:MAG: DNA cytosine methyltransferase [Oscillospiraceae bacterium]|nr:DNA cytosine methyltransferase [Oscillospiraceae bacterium]
MQSAVIDVFCGIGGLTHGIQKAGINVVAGIDIDSTCKYAYEKNNNAVFINKDIENITCEEIDLLYPPNCHKILVGCAPCQPFSPYSFRYNKNGKKDNKWKLLYSFINIIEEISPSIISMENVPQLSKEKIFSDFLDKLNNLGYIVDWDIINCAKYGVPQNRTRLVLLASLFGKINVPPAIYDQKDFLTVFDAIGDLPRIKDGEICEEDLLHRSSKLAPINKKRIKQSTPGGTWITWNDKLKLKCHKKDTGNSYRSVYGRMEWEKPSPTITTQFYGYGNGRFGHPEQNRALSLREGALLQSFPDYYKFIDPDSPPTYKKLGVHIGNAVPVELGKVIGSSIKNHLLEKGVSCDG